MSSTPETPDPLKGLDFDMSVDPDFLEAAVNHKKVFDAHVSVGFTEEQAVLITGQVIRAYGEMTAAKIAMSTLNGDEDEGGTN